MEQQHLPGGPLVQYRIHISPRPAGDWHLNMVVADYWTVEPLVITDLKVDTIAVAQDAIDGWLTEQRQEHHQSREEPPSPST